MLLPDLLVHGLYLRWSLWLTLVPAVFGIRECVVAYWPLLVRRWSSPTILSAATVRS